VTFRERWNFCVNCVDIALITLGLSLVSRETVIPVLVSRLTGSQVAVGVVPMIYTGCYLLPQVFVANYFERLSLKKPFLMVVSSLGERLPYLLIGVIVFFFGAAYPRLTYAALIVLLGVSALSNGICTPAWMDMIAKVIPVGKRGLFFRQNPTLLATGGAAFIGIILGAVSFPKDFGVLFLMAWTSMMVSWLGLSLTKETPGPTTKPKVSIMHHLKGVGGILRRERNFRSFVVAESLIHFGAMANPFFIIAAGSHNPTSTQWIGFYTGLLVASQTGSYFVVGIIGDRLGHKRALLAGASALVLANVVALLAPSSLAYSLVFVALGVFISSDTVSRMSIVVELCAAEERPTFIGLSNTILSISSSVAPIVGGIISSRYGFGSLFVLAGSIGVFGVLTLTLIFRDPRYPARKQF